MYQSVLPARCLPLSLFNEQLSGFTDEKKWAYLILIKSTLFYSHSVFNIIS